MTSLGPQGSNPSRQFSTNPPHENGTALTTETILNLTAREDSNLLAKGDLLGQEATDNPEGYNTPAQATRANIPSHRIGWCNAPKRPNSIPIQPEFHHRAGAGWPTTDSPPPPDLPNDQEFPDLISPLSAVGSIQYLPLLTLENELDRGSQDSENDDDNDNGNDNNAENNDNEKAPWQPKLKRKKPAAGKSFTLYEYFESAIQYFESK